MVKTTVANIFKVKTWETIAFKIKKVSKTSIKLVNLYIQRKEKIELILGKEATTVMKVVRLKLP